ncbi:FAD-dependent monooxygenase [Jatrophihabitans endophyticus]|uniref:FAD-dependent monooxygenase n=1 Tax=Jatrophihabitans endophyticus TaxID=1206085 RepID=UPI0019F26BED|nr:FAD-dependent monooxygenase [Jatrophihabitans endophyticus]MBE7188199.1 FAD-dependent monooxygenase [Jatrophihabitans endophyticus]
MNASVLISGAGPAGMSLARLLQADGWSVTVVERAPAVRSGGYAVDLRDEGMDVAAELGVLDALQARRTAMTGTSLLDADGAVVGELPAEEFAGALEVPKPVLVEQLFALTRDTVEYVFDDSIAGLVHRDEGVDVTLASGATRSCALVVGADGVWSATRRLAVTDRPDVVRHLGLSGAGFTTDNVLGLDHRGVLRTGRGTATYAFSEADRARMTVSLTFATSSAALDRAPRDEQQAAVRGAFAGDGWRTPELLDAMGHADDFYFASAAQVHLPTWSAGRVVLLGDAACCAAPTSGMGTTQAFVAARALARALRGADLGAGLARYEREVRPFAEANQKLGAEGAVRFGATG